MPDPKPNPGGWRDIGAQTNDAAKRQRGWQQNAPAAGGVRKPISRGAKRFLAITAITVLCVAVVVVVKWLRPYRASLVVIGAGYEKNLLLPHNVHGWNGLKNLSSVATVESYSDLLFWQQPAGMRRSGDPLEMRPGQLWKDIWKEVAKSLGEETTVICISLHGLADKTDAYLLANDPSPEALQESNPGKRSLVSFKEILGSLREVDRNRKLVLLLDVCQMESHWPIGLLHNEFVARVQEKYGKEIEDMGNLVVICAAGPDQRGWVSDEWQNSMFLHFVAEGLRRAAGSEGENITARKLYDYVDRKVTQWAETNRAQKQKPVMIAKAGLAETVAILHVSTPYTEKSPQQAPARDFTREQQQAVRSEWTKWRELRELAPFAYSPHRWRLYEATLLRFEQLVRAGDPTEKAAELRTRLAELETEIRKARTLDAAFDALGGSMPMPAVLGYDPMPADKVIELFGKLRLADDEKIRMELLAPLKEKFPAIRQYARLRLASALLGQLERSGNAELLSTLVKLQEAVEAGLPSLRRPAEAQLLKMLARDMLQPETQFEAVKLAIGTRVLAEQTALSATGTLPHYLYSEAIFPWIRGAVERADAERRLGEDRLFGDPRTVLEKGRASLTAARSIYKKTGEDVGQMRDALLARDEACCELPYLAQWLALAPLPQDPKEAKVFQTLRDDLTALGDALALLGPEADRKGASAVELDRLTLPVRKTLKEIRDKYHQTAKNSTATVFQRNWHDIDSVLGIPLSFGDVEVRLGLLDKLRRISRGLADADARNPVEEREPLAVRSKRQADMLRASLRPYPILHVEGEASLNERLQGEFIKLPRTINSTETALLDAANLCRGIPAGLAEYVEAKPFHPVEWLRRKRMHELLRWQAERTWQDHWFDPGDLPGREDPYYLPTGLAYLDAAVDSIKDHAQTDLVKTLRSEIDVYRRQKFVVGRLKAGKDFVVGWTSAEEKKEIAWQIQQEGTVPAGEPSRWSQLSSPERLSQREKIDWPAEGKPLEAKFRFNQDAVWGGEVRGERRAQLHAVFRGQHLLQKVDFEGLKPDVIVHEPPPPDVSRVAVRMDSKFNYGAISILLDNSGSMLWLPGVNKSPKPGDPKQKSRWQFAMKALRGVLEKIPDGTELSIFTFKNDNTEIGRTGIRALLPEPMPWDAFQTEKLLKNLETLSKEESFFNNSSPIARGIITCKTKGFRKNFNGPQVVVALTDGSDNYSFDLNEKRNKARVPPELQLSNDKYPNIDVVVVCFMDAKNEEYADAVYQFGGVKYFKGVKEGRSRSKFVTEADGLKLGTTILQMIRPRLELYYLTGGLVPSFQYPEHAIDLPTAPPEWVDVPPGTYVARLAQLPHTPQNLVLDPAQNMFLVLKGRDRVQYLERGLIHKQPEVTSEFKVPRKDWYVSLLEHKISFGSDLEQMIAVENTTTSTERALEVLRQPRPDFVWLELEAAAGKKPNTPLYWQHAHDAAAPAYRLKMSTWPRDLQPRLKVWFWPQSSGALFQQNELVTSSFLQCRNRVFDKGFQLKGMQGPAWESNPGNQRKALVVRTSTPGQKVMARLLNVDPPAKKLEVEHLYYGDTGQYTAYFYGLGDDFRAELALVNVTALKEHPQTQFVVFPSEGTRLPDAITAPDGFVPGRYSKTVP